MLSDPPTPGAAQHPSPSYVPCISQAVVATTAHQLPDTRFEHGTKEHHLLRLLHDLTGTPVTLLCKLVELLLLEIPFPFASC